MKQFILTCMILAASFLAAFAQVTSGRLEGTVTDPQGATVPNAKVSVANTQTNPSSLSLRVAGVATSTTFPTDDENCELFMEDSFC